VVSGLGKKGCQKGSAPASGGRERSPPGGAACGRRVSSRGRRQHGRVAIGMEEGRNSW
jgi:hypothetical protein